MHSESTFNIRKVWELVGHCAEQRAHGHWVNMGDFHNALDSWEIGRKEADATIQDLEHQNYLLTMTSEEDDEITDIVILCRSTAVLVVV
jgi:hypothetical protein